MSDRGDGAEKSCKPIPSRLWVCAHTDELKTAKREQLKNHKIMSVKIERIEGNLEVIGYYLNGVKVKESRRRITNWK